MDRIFGLDKVGSHPENAELLVSVNDNVQLAVIQSILDGENIPYLVKNRGSGTVVKVITGFSVFGADIFVLKEDIEKAKELIRPLSDEELRAIDAEIDGEAEEN